MGRIASQLFEDKMCYECKILMLNFVVKLMGLTPLIVATLRSHGDGSSGMRVNASKVMYQVDMTK